MKGNIRILAIAAAAFGFSSFAHAENTQGNAGTDPADTTSRPRPANPNAIAPQVIVPPGGGPAQTYTPPRPGSLAARQPYAQQPYAQQGYGNGRNQYGYPPGRGDDRYGNRDNPRYGDRRYDGRGYNPYADRYYGGRPAPYGYGRRYEDDDDD